jgi:uroporphyrinogen-III decarboxylase
MTSRERITACIHGQEVDRFPVWLKMANRTWQSPQSEPFRSMGGEQLLRECGCDVMLGCGLPAGSVKVSRPHVQVRAERDKDVRRTFIDTPDRVLVGEESFDPFTESWHPTRFCAGTLDDLRALRWFYADTEYEVDVQVAAQAAEHQRAYEARDVFTMTGVGPGPLMDMIEHLCGPEASIYHMADDRNLFEETLEIMHQDRLRFLRAVLPYHVADTFWLTENTSTTLISPTMFETYAMPHLTEYGNLVLDNDMIPVHHMCGTLNALLEQIDTLPALANEAYTTRPLGDVSLAEGRRRMPSKALIGGTNATLWMASAERIVEEVAADLDQCPDRRKIFLTSAGVLPPCATFEKSRRVVEALKSL